MDKLKIIFMGTPEFAKITLQKLVEESIHEVICVYTQPPRPAGRGQKLRLSETHQYAIDNGIEVRHPKSVKSTESQEDFKKLNADIGIVAAYGLILPQEILDAPKYGCLNIHGSLLPRWRGAAPIQRAIMAGDTETGICIMQMDAGLDTGDVLLKDTVKINNHTTASTLHDELADMGANLTLKTLDMIASDNYPKPEKQSDNGMTYAKMLSRDDGKVDWSKNAIEIERQLRALTPWPGVWFMLNDKRIKLINAEISDLTGDIGEILSKDMIIGCGEKSLKLTKIQPENKKPMDGTSFLNGSQLKIGDNIL